MKSYVTMEQKCCIICGKEYDSGALLMDMRLKERFEMHTVTGYGMCEEHEDLRKRDYIALVGVDESKSIVGTDTIKPENAYRTGRLAHIREEVFNRIFNVEAPSDKVVFCQDEVISMLERAQIKKDGENEKR